MLDIAKFNEILDELHADSAEIEASALITDDGMMMASHLPMGVNEERISAMSAALLSVSERMIDTLSGNESERVMVQSKVGYVIVSAVAESLLLTVVARPDAKLGMVFHDIKKASQAVQAVLNSQVA
ncbi:Roadblock/LC7 domain [Moraxella caprae]|uniref:Roadblock/LC7 domain n=1 Tax=Moraxella caprae TaxID=90240 RepID=A0A378QY84_9GAMM|nr:roadblock/LC7 domain-containing protein [Moraxella caprae]STZ07361.1 Roadblock/LC7 domain [Moraxella caprae]